MLKTMITKIDQSLAQFLEQIKKDYQLHLVDPILYKSIKEFVLRKGKRIRPILLVLSYKGYSKDKKNTTPSIYYVSTCIELLHNFMLIHDDIIDRSHLRRGKPTMHRLLAKAAKTKEQTKLGENLGIVVGDIVYACAIDAFLSIKEDLRRKEQALKYFIQTAVLTAMGEFIDTLYGVQPIRKVSEKDIFLNYTLKTARYTFDCPLVVGAILAGADKKEIQRLSRLGLLIGQAFQIQDDIIGIFDTQKNIGKSILSDIAESKKTILVSHAYRTLSPSKQKEFLKYFTKPRKTYHDLLSIRKIFKDAGSLQYSLDHIQKRLVEASGIIDQLKMKNNYRKFLRKSLLKMFEHSQQIATQNHL
ncbi:MAG: polyprenyl synthetase family protein [Candidatus Omnitrophica bacterium]|nr:polyprenyl synthetase family protein [Candidatus Omnitrophota bacterium]